MSKANSKLSKFERTVFEWGIIKRDAEPVTRYHLSYQPCSVFPIKVGHGEQRRQVHSDFQDLQQNKRRHVFHFRKNDQENYHSSNIFGSEYYLWYDTRISDEFDPPSGQAVVPGRRGVI